MFPSFSQEETHHNRNKNTTTELGCLVPNASSPGPPASTMFAICVFHGHNFTWKKSIDKKRCKKMPFRGRLVENKQKTAGYFSKEAVGMCYSQLLTFKFCTTQILWYVFLFFLGSSYGACKLISSGGSFHMSQISIESAPVDDCKWHIVFSGQKTRRMAWIREYMPIVAARDNISRLTREIKIALARKMPISYFCCTARIESMTNFGLISPLKG